MNTEELGRLKLKAFFHNDDEIDKFLLQSTKRIRKFCQENLADEDINNVLIMSRTFKNRQYKHTSRTKMKQEIEEHKQLYFQKTEQLKSVSQELLECKLKMQAIELDNMHLKITLSQYQTSFIQQFAIQLHEHEQRFNP